MKLIALTGLASSGKSTVAGFIEGASFFAFAEPLKRFCAEVFGFTDEELYGPSEARERPSKRFTRPNGQPLTARYALQTLGTEWGRNCDPDVWAKAGVRKALAAAAARLDAPRVITDLRFVNEARLVREAGGEVWRVRRGPIALDMRDLHASEREVWSPEMTALVTHEIVNGDTKDALCARVQEALCQRPRS